MDSLRVSNYIHFIACMTPNVLPSAFTKLSANARPMAEPQQAMRRRDTDTDTDMAIMPVMARVPATQVFVTNSVETRFYGSCGSLAPPSPPYVPFSFSYSFLLHDLSLTVSPLHSTNGHLASSAGLASSAASLRSSLPSRGLASACSPSSRFSRSCSTLLRMAERTIMVPMAGTIPVPVLEQAWAIMPATTTVLA